jgi:hypothetical protein
MQADQFRNRCWHRSPRLIGWQDALLQNNAVFDA